MYEAAKHAYCGLTENAGHEIAENEIARHDKYRDRA